jgi:hypothetical protein
LVFEHRFFPLGIFLAVLHLDWCVLASGVPSVALAAPAKSVAAASIATDAPNIITVRQREASGDARRASRSPETLWCRSPGIGYGR